MSICAAFSRKRFARKREFWWPLFVPPWWSVTGQSLLERACVWVPRRTCARTCARARRSCWRISTVVSLFLIELVAKSLSISGKCTIIGGSEFGIMGWYRAGVKLTWGFTKESLQDATHTPTPSLICGSRPPNIVDLPEFKGRLTTSTRYHDCRGGGKRISRRKKHLREPRRTTRGGGNTPPGPRGAEAYGHPGTPDRRPFGA